MKNRLILLLTILTICMSSLAGKVVIGDSLKVKLTRNALNNLKNLPTKTRKQYSSFLLKYNDGLMAFLLSSEESSKLYAADPEEIEKHYLSYKKLADSSDYDYPAAVFLSYVAKITVSDERIQFYRDEMLNAGIQDIIDKNKDTEDLVRELNLWSRKYLSFEPTSGRDMSPLDILNKCNVGRCEESQIFFVAAARAAGIPARPAFTPWWAHIDNNHAWCEVFVKGQWHYLGGCEPEYDLNRSWFTNLIDKAVLVVSEGAFPDSSEEVLIKNKYMSFLNTTAIYANKNNQPRKVLIKTKENGNPLPKTPLQIMVYNWASLRALMHVETDSLGEKNITLGTGSSFLYAELDSLKGYVFLNESPNDTTVVINLSKDELPFLDLTFKYPAPISYEWPARPDYDKKRSAVYEFYDKLIKMTADQPFPDPAAEKDSVLSQVWVNCRANKAEFVKFYLETKPDKEFLRLCLQLDKKYFYQMNASQFANLWASYNDFKRAGLKFDDKIWVNLMSPTVYFEEIPGIRLPLIFTKWREGELLTRITGIAKFMKSKYKIDPKKALAGLLPYDKIANLKEVSDTQYRILACQVYKANYIPCDLAEIPQTLSIYYQDKWQYFDIKTCKFLSDSGKKKNEEKPGKNLFVSFTDELGQKIKLEENQLLITQKNGFYPNDIQPEADSNYIYSCALLSGYYQLQVGYRISGEETKYYLFPLKIEKGKIIKEKYVLKRYPYDWKEVPEEYKPLLKLENPQSKDLIVLIGDHDREMIRRLSDKVKEKSSGQDFVWIGGKTSQENLVNYKTNSEYVKLLKLNPAWESQFLTFYYQAEQKKWTMYLGFWDNLPKK